MTARQPPIRYLMSRMLTRGCSVQAVRDHVQVAALQEASPAEAAALLDRQLARRAGELDRLMRAAQSADRELPDGQGADTAMAGFKAAVEEYMPGEHSPQYQACI